VEEIMRTTFIAKPAEVTRKWYLIDATGHTLGRLSTEVATILRGKHKPIYTPHVDTGDHVIIINAEKIVVTGKKLDQKTYTRHSGYVGNLKTTTLRNVLAKRPENVLMYSIRGMLPKTTLGRQMLKKLRVYKGPDHEHASQKPELLVINE